MIPKPIAPREETILLVEDSPTQALRLQLLLQEKGFATQTAMSIGEALAALQHHSSPPDSSPPDSSPGEAPDATPDATPDAAPDADAAAIQLVMLDLNLPDSSGLATLALLREHHPELPIVVMTILSDVQLAIQALQQGAQDYLVKGQFDPELLDRTIRYAVERHRINMERKALTETLRHKNEELARLNELKNQFLGIAAHDLRNPIHVVLGYSQLLRSWYHDPDDARLDKIIRGLNNAATFMWQLVNDLLDLSAIEAGKLQLRLKEVDLSALIHDNLEQNRTFAEQKAQQLISDVAPDLPTVQIDPPKLHQVLNNLLTNAFKFSQPNSRIFLDARRHQDEIIITVRDEGQGIPPERLASLFQAFGQHSKGTAGEKGTGLGLAIVRKIVEGHGGRIWVESEPGQGSSFSFTIPLQQQERARAKDADDRAQAPP